MCVRIDLELLMVMKSSGPRFPVVSLLQPDVNFATRRGLDRCCDAMRPAFQRGLRTLSWTRVVPRAHRHARWIQIRAAPTGDPTVNGDHLPLASTPSSAESRGIVQEVFQRAHTDR